MRTFVVLGGTEPLGERLPERASSLIRSMREIWRAMAHSGSRKCEAPQFAKEEQRFQMRMDRR